MSERIVVFGYGASGRAIVPRLLAKGARVRVAQRTRPVDLPAGVEFQSCDVAKAPSLTAAAEGADQMVIAVGLPYEGPVWRRLWPTVMSNFITACETTRARAVFIDNLYMYGPQDRPLREDMPLTHAGVKPAARSEATRRWMEASQAGRIRMAALRSPDFYGPGVEQSHLGAAAFGALAKGKSASLLAPPDTPHDFAYVPDLARAALSLLEAPDDVYGQVWHAPCAPIQTPRQILALGAQALGMKLKLNVVPLGLLPVLGIAAPFLRELAEMRFQWDRPYRVDGSKFKERFWSDATPFAVGAAATALSFRPAGATAALPSSRAPRQLPIA